MIDLLTLREVLRNLKTQTRLVFVGDINQLPSVGIGDCLRALISSNVIPKVMLTKTFRQENNSTLFLNIKKIENSDCELIAGNDFVLIELA